MRRVLTAAGLSEAVTFGFIEARGAPTAFAHARRRRSIVAHRQSAVGEVRHAPAVAAARASSTRSRTTAGTAGATSRSSKSARDSRIGGETRGVARRRGPARRRRALVRRRARGRFLRRQGARRAAVRGARRRASASNRRTPPFLVAGQAAAIVAGPAQRARSASSDCSRRRSPTARGAPRQDRVFVAELTSTRCGDARRAATRPSRRCRAIRSSSAICRSSSPIPCLRKSFVAPFRRPASDGAAPLVGDRVLRSLSRARVSPTDAVSLSVRLTFQAAGSDADRRRGAAECRSRFSPRSCSEHGAVQR